MSSQAHSRKRDDDRRKARRTGEAVLFEETRRRRVASVSRQRVAGFCDPRRRAEKTAKPPILAFACVQPLGIVNNLGRCSAGFPALHPTLFSPTSPRNEKGSIQARHSRYRFGGATGKSCVFAEGPESRNRMYMKRFLSFGPGLRQQLQPRRGDRSFKNNGGGSSNLRVLLGSWCRFDVLGG